MTLHDLARDILDYADKSRHAGENETLRQMMVVHMLRTGIPQVLGAAFGRLLSV